MFFICSICNCNIQQSYDNTKTLDNITEHITGIKHLFSLHMINNILDENENINVLSGYLFCYTCNYSMDLLSNYDITWCNIKNHIESDIHQKNISSPDYNVFENELYKEVINMEEDLIIKKNDSSYAGSCSDKMLNTGEIYYSSNSSLSDCEMREDEENAKTVSVVNYHIIDNDSVTDNAGSTFSKYNTYFSTDEMKLRYFNSFKPELCKYDSSIKDYNVSCGDNFKSNNCYAPYFFCLLCKCVIMTSKDITITKNNVVSHVIGEQHQYNLNQFGIQSEYNRMVCNTCDCTVQLSCNSEISKVNLITHIDGRRHCKDLFKKQCDLLENNKYYFNMNADNQMN